VRIEVVAVVIEEGVDRTEWRYSREVDCLVDWDGEQWRREYRKGYITTRATLAMP
jgi:hypothetical protein